jgi:hypothetical protein
MYSHAQVTSRNCMLIIICTLCSSMLSNNPGQKPSTRYPAMILRLGRDGITTANPNQRRPSSLIRPGLSESYLLGIAREFISEFDKMTQCLEAVAETLVRISLPSERIGVDLVVGVNVPHNSDVSH